MSHRIGTTLALSVSTLVLGASLVLASTLGTVTTVDDKGVATIKLEDGKELKVKALEGWKKGLAVDCEVTADKTECRPAK